MRCTLTVTERPSADVDGVTSLPRPCRAPPRRRNRIDRPSCRSSVRLRWTTRRRHRLRCVDTRSKAIYDSVASGPGCKRRATFVRRSNAKLDSTRLIGACTYACPYFHGKLTAQLAMSACKGALTARYIAVFGLARPTHRHF